MTYVKNIIMILAMEFMNFMVSIDPTIPTKLVLLAEVISIARIGATLIWGIDGYNWATSIKIIIDMSRICLASFLGQWELVR